MRPSLGWTKSSVQTPAFMHKLYQLLAVAYAPENVKAQLAKLAKLKDAERELECQKREAVVAILDEAGAGNHHQPIEHRIHHTLAEAAKLENSFARVG